MSKKKHVPRYVAEVPIPSTYNFKEIPEAVLHGRSLIEAEAAKKNSMHIDVNGQYRQIDEFEVNGHRIEIGAIGKGYAAINERYTKLFFAFASFMARQGEYATHRFDKQQNTLLPVSLDMHEHDKNAYLVYIPKDAAKIAVNGAISHPIGFTTGEQLLAVDDCAVSFVASSRSQRTSETVMATATEITQNRLIVGRIKLNKGWKSEDRDVTGTFQEAVANGAGNMLGAIALGYSYRRYEEYLQDIYDHTPNWASSMKGRFGLRSIEVFAPHIMFDRQVYDQLADGEMPTSAPVLRARQPIP